MPNTNRSLTKRQAEVHVLILQGLTNKQIATLLKLAEQTVRHHTSAIYRKKNVKTRVALILSEKGSLVN